MVDISLMFADARSFNQPLDEWDVSLARGGFFSIFARKGMFGMFRGAALFNQPLSTWSVGQDLNRGIEAVSDISEMFLGALSFRQGLCAWGPLLSQTADVASAFKDTACPNTSDPDLRSDPPGPLCFVC